jgi:hypothetical protein
MYLRETRRRNKDGTVASYLQLAHNERHPVSGVPTARVIHSFGRAETVDRDGLARLVRSISRYLDPADAVAAAQGLEGIDIVDSRPMGGAWVLDRLWERLGIGAAIREAARGRRVDAAVTERVIFAMVANRALDPLSKLAACDWVGEQVFIEGLEAVDSEACYRAMDFLLSALDGLAETVFFSVANLLDLEVDLLFFDTTSTYFECDWADPALIEATSEEGDGEGTSPTAGAPRSKGFRTHGRSKDHRPDLPQVVVGMAVTREGIPVRCWTFPGNASDQVLIRQVRDDLAGWNLNRVVWVLDRGFTSEENRRYLQRGGGHYIVGEKLRGDSAEAAAALSRQGRYHQVAGNLRVKEVRVDDGVMRDRFVICHNPDRARRDATVRAEILAALETEIAGSDSLTPSERAALAARLHTKAAWSRFLRTTPKGLLRLDRAAISREAHLDGKFLLRTSDETLSAADIALGYKALYEVERGWRDMKSTITDLRPVFHRKKERICAHVQLCFLALLLARVAEITVGDTWRNIANELDRLHLVTLRTGEGTIAQRSELTPGQRSTVTALGLAEPPRYFDFSPATD